MNILVYTSPDLLNQVGDLPAFRGPLSSLNDVAWEFTPAVKHPPAPVPVSACPSHTCVTMHRVLRAFLAV